MCRLLTELAVKQISNYVGYVVALGIAMALHGCHEAPLPPSVPGDLDWIGEPVGPIEVIEAAGLLDGGTKVCGLRDGRGKEYWFVVTPFSFEGERPVPTNRLVLFKSNPWEKVGRWDDRARTAELRSPEEAFVRNALRLAIADFPEQRPDEPPEYQLRREYLIIMLKRLDTLGLTEGEGDAC